MKHFMHCSAAVLTMLLILITNPHAQTLRTLEREWEPVVVPAYNLPQLDSIAVADLHLYAYNATVDLWSLIPFQIDEQSYGPNTLNKNENRWYYFVPEWWANVDTLVDAHNGIFDDHDELAFMARDLGDKAPREKWIDDAEARTHPRLELIVTDPLDVSKKAYGYLYRSSTIQEAVPRPYNLQYYPAQDRIETSYYALGIDSELGVIKDIVIKTPFGSGVDIFDRQKFRFFGILDFLGFQIDAYLNETALTVPDTAVVLTNDNPVVRLIRVVQQGLNLQGLQIAGVNFWVTAKFYPFNGTIKGGGSLDAAKIKEQYPDSEFGVILKYLRQSWDFNSAATGMKFHTRHNQNITVDGIPDAVNQTIDAIPVNEWTLTSGEQGSFFTYVKFEEPNWSSATLYYYDNKNGGQGDGTIFPELSDTGDAVSYGDNGILFSSAGLQVVTLDLDFIGYFLPKNKDKAFGEQMARWVENPLLVDRVIIADVEDDHDYDVVREFNLLQNYPNPFNSATIIPFVLPKSGHISLKIFDTGGRLVRMIASGHFERGHHTADWDGVDSQGNAVASGIYLYELTADNYSATRKLLILR